MTTEDVIADLLAKWQHLRRQGRVASLEELCRDTPHLVEELRSRIAAEQNNFDPDSATASKRDAPTDLAATVSEGVHRLSPNQTTQTIHRHEGASASQWSIEGYEILREIGMGGMGIVYEAREKHLDRVVALKILRGGVLAGRAAIDRFRQEARVMAQVDCPNIVPIYHVGEHQGQPFLTMKLMRGGNLQESLRRGPIDRTMAIRLMLVVARAVQHLHARKIVHRDLKPLNILFDESGDPHITDFGLAKFLEPDRPDFQTLTGAILGTRHYMAPEQTLGLVNQISPATDVWALGVILFQLTTGKKPFGGATDDELRYAISNVEVVSPRQLQRDIDPGLERIILTCLRKNSGERYPHAGALANDLNLWLLGELPPEAGSRLPIGALTTRRRMLKTSAVILCGFGSLAAVGTIGYLKLTRSQDKTLSDPIQLIGESGPPNNYRWVIDDQSKVKPTNDNEPFSLESKNIALIELLSPVPWDSYRFEADVRQEREQGFVGVCLSQRDFVSKGEAFHYYWKVTYADKGRGAGGVSLSCQVVPAEGLLNVYNLASFPVWAFDAIRHANVLDDWRHLAIEVSPQSFSIDLDRQRVGEQALSEMDKRAESRARDFPDVNLQFNPRGGIGLLLSDGSASFRNVSIRPTK